MYSVSTDKERCLSEAMDMPSLQMAGFGVELCEVNSKKGPLRANQRLRPAALIIKKREYLSL
jgi:hypothetical protein